VPLAWAVSVGALLRRRFKIQLRTRAWNNGVALMCQFVIS